MCSTGQSKSQLTTDFKVRKTFPMHTLSNGIYLSVNLDIELVNRVTANLQLMLLNLHL